MSPRGITYVCDRSWRHLPQTPGNDAWDSLEQLWSNFELATSHTYVMSPTPDLAKSWA